MDQCSKHDTAPAFSAVLTNRSGHVLRLELDAQIVVVLTDRRFGVIFSKTMTDTIRLVKQLPICHRRSRRRIQTFLGVRCRLT